jgi:hypothetical protein
MAPGDPEDRLAGEDDEEELALEPTGTFEIRPPAVPRPEPGSGTETAAPGPPTSATEHATGTFEIESGRDERDGEDFTAPTIAPMAGGERPRFSEAIVLSGEQVKPPSFRPFTPARFAAWPLSGEHAPDFLARCFRTLLVCAGAWLLGTAPYAGTPLRLIIEGIAALTVFFYLVRVVLAALDKRPDPPPFVRFSMETDAVQESFRVLLLFTIHILPGILIASAMGFDPYALGRTALSVFLYFAVLLGGWYLFPASLLLLSVTGRLSALRPAHVLAAAWSGGPLYFLNLLPGAAILVARLTFWKGWEGDFLGAILEGIAFPVLVYTALIVGTIAREKDRVTEVVLAAGRLVLEDEEPDGE